MKRIYCLLIVLSLGVTVQNVEAKKRSRRHLKGRFGMVAFGGVGGVARRWNEFRMDELLPAAGAGLRFTLEKKNHINYRVDWAIGRAGHTLTIGIGEAF
jgi:hypothetical protein